MTIFLVVLWLVVLVLAYSVFGVMGGAVVFLAVIAGLAAARQPNPDGGE